MTKKKLSGIHFGQRHKQVGQSDIDILISLNTYLWQKFGMAFKREWYFGFNEFGNIEFFKKEVTHFDVQRCKIRNPDLTFRHNNGRFLVIEVDGNAHKWDVSRTLDRNHDYELAGIDYIVLDLPDLRELGVSPEDKLDEEIGKWKTINGLA